MSKIIDFHAHVLPYADHGSKSVETSLKQLMLQKSRGVDVVVATPHFYPSSTKVDDFLDLRSKSIEKLLASEAKELKVPVIAAAEVLVCEGMEYMSGLEKLCIPGTNSILLEMPMKEWSSELYDTVEKIAEKHTVILAHVDRYPFNDVVQFLEFDNVYAQMNPSELTGFFPKKKYLDLIDKGWVVALGSDLHSANEKQVGDFFKALKKIGSKRTDKIMTAAEEMLKNAEYII